MAFHYLSGHCRHALALSAQMWFASNSLYHTIAKKVKHKSGLGSFPIGRRLSGCFPYTTPPTESFLLCRFSAWQEQRCYVMWGFLLNGSFLHLAFDCKIQNWGRTWLDHFALGRASVQPTNRLCAVTLAQINKSVCLQTSPATIAATVGGEVYMCSRHAASRIGNVQKSQFAFV